VKTRRYQAKKERKENAARVIQKWYREIKKYQKGEDNRDKNNQMYQEYLLGQNLEVKAKKSQNRNN
jgi:hypothetical protein